MVVRKCRVVFFWKRSQTDVIFIDINNKDAIMNASPEDGSTNIHRSVFLLFLITALGASTLVFSYSNPRDTHFSPAPEDRGLAIEQSAESTGNPFPDGASASMTNTLAQGNNQDCPMFYFALGGSSVPDSYDSPFTILCGLQLMSWDRDSLVGIYVDLSFGWRGLPSGQKRMQSDIGCGFVIGRDVFFSAGGYASLNYGLDDWTAAVPDPNSPGSTISMTDEPFCEVVGGLKFGLGFNLAATKSGNSNTAKPVYLLMEMRMNLGHYRGELTNDPWLNTSFTVGLGLCL